MLFQGRSDRIRCYYDPEFHRYFRLPTHEQLIGMKKKENRFRPEYKDISLDYLVMYYRHMAAYDFAKRYVEGKSVLEVCCGEGYGSFHLASSAGSLLAADIDRKTVATAAKKYSRPNLTFKAFDACDMPLDSGQYDIVVGLQAIEHIENVDIFLEEIRRVLKPDGFFVFSTPNRTIRLEPGEKSYNRAHCREFSAGDLRAHMNSGPGSLHLWALHYTEPLFQLELQRIQRLKRIVKYDVLGMINLIPYRWEPLTTKYIKKLEGLLRGNSEDLQIRKEDVYITRDGLDNAVDLVGLCLMNGSTPPDPCGAETAQP